MINGACSRNRQTLDRARIFSFFPSRDLSGDTMPSSLRLDTLDVLLKMLAEKNNGVYRRVDT